MAFGVGGCFSASFLEDTCERLPGGCGGGSTSTGGSTAGSTSGGEVLPTTTGGTGSSSGGDSTSGSTGAPPGLLYPGPAFRITEMRIVDPHLYISFPLCLDGQEAVNTALADSLESHETNVILLAQGFDPDAATQTFWLYRGANCPVGESYCLLDDLISPTVFVSFNRDDQDCLDVDEATINPSNVDDLIVPKAPCVVSPKASLPIQLTPELSPLIFYQGQFAAQYETDDKDPTVLRDAVLFGFVPKSQAETLEYNYKGTKINMWSVIRGSDHPQACPADELSPGVAHNSRNPHRVLVRHRSISSLTIQSSASRASVSVRSM